VYLWKPLTLAWHRPDPLGRWVAILAFVAYAAIFLFSFILSRRRLNAGAEVSRGLAIALLVGATLLVLVAAALVGEESLGLLVYVGVMAILLLRGWSGPLVVLILILGTAAAQHVVPGWQPDIDTQFAQFVAALATWGVVQLVLRNGELAAAREQITQLAIDEERNRFARDLHDILGHSLTVVAIKAELAGRLVRLDPDKAEAEIADVERLSRQALAEVRTAVAGYRDVTLSGELVNARTALVAAGIDADLPTAIDEVPQRHRELFAWVVREGVTNVVRHSGASRCLVRVGPGTVEITDNGATRGTPARAAVGHGLAGHGLVGLRERAEAAGGSLSVGSAPDGGFRLTVRV
jgi:two-component system sensor histidine kinase DesK